MVSSSPRKTTIYFPYIYVGSLDLNFLVEVKLGFPLNPQTKSSLLQRGQQKPSFEGGKKPERRSEAMLGGSDFR